MHHTSHVLPSGHATEMVWRDQCSHVYGWMPYFDFNCKFRLFAYSVQWLPCLSLVYVIPRCLVSPFHVWHVPVCLHLWFEPCTLWCLEFDYQMEVVDCRRMESSAWSRTLSYCEKFLQLVTVQPSYASCSCERLGETAELFGSAAWTEDQSGGGLWSEVRNQFRGECPL